MFNQTDLLLSRTGTWEKSMQKLIFMRWIYGSALALSTLATLPAGASEGIEYFDKKTGQLHWQLGDRIRLVLDDGCEPVRKNLLVSRSSYPVNEELLPPYLNFFKTIDLFDAIPYVYFEEDSQHSCKDQRLLRVENALRTDGFFENPSSQYEAYVTVEINGESLGIPKDEYGKKIYAEKNYQPIFSALTRKAPIIATYSYYEEYSRAKSRALAGEYGPELTKFVLKRTQISIYPVPIYEGRYSINSSNIKEAFAIRSSYVEASIDAHNKEKAEELRSSYPGVAVSFIMTLVALVFIAVVLRKFIPSTIRKLIAFSKNSYLAIKDNIRRRISKPKLSSSSIIKSENLKNYSVADELLKWAQLKEDGHITEEEFNEARRKILN